MTVSGIVERATSELLAGPDWAINVDLCDVINNDPSQAKDVIKTVKRRLTNRNPMVQLLALTLLETLIRNCGDNVHQHIQDREVLQEMVKIMKKKVDTRVRDKIIVLVDSWKETFGGHGAPYPQYYMAYSQLQSLGVQFPRHRDVHRVPTLIPPQSQSIASPYHSLSSGLQPSGMVTPRSEANIHIPSMSLTDIQNTRGVIEVLSEMLSAVPPRDRMAIRGEVIVDLVEQCRTTQRAIMHLVNTTSNEEELREGLSLHDDLLHVLAKHDALISGAPIPAEPKRPASAQVEEASCIMPVNLKLSTSKPALARPTQEIAKKPVAVSSSATNDSRGPLLDLLSGEPVDPFNSTTVPPAPTEQYVGQLSLLALPAPEGSLNAFGSMAYHAAPNLQQSVNGSLSQPSSQPQASNGNMVPPFQAFHQQLPDMVQNDYAAPWSMAALAAGHTLTAQQRSMIYGDVQPQSPQLPQSPLGHQPQAQQTQNTYSPVQQQQQQQPAVRTPPPWQDGSEMERQQQLQGGYQVPAQWTGINQPQQWSAQQQAIMNAQFNAGSWIPPSPAQYEQWQQYLQQLQQVRASYDPYKMGSVSGMQDVFGRTHNLSAQDASRHMQNLPVGSQYKQSLVMVPFPQASPPKPVNASDKLFEDLVDFRSVDAKFKAAGLVENIARPNSSTVGS